MSVIGVKDYTKLLEQEKEWCIKHINDDREQIQPIICFPEREFKKGFIKGIERAIYVLGTEPEVNNVDKVDDKELFEITPEIDEVIKGSKKHAYGPSNTFIVNWGYFHHLEEIKTRYEQIKEIINIRSDVL